MSEDGRRFFGTDGIRGKANEPPLTPEFAVRLGQAAAAVFLETRAATVREWPAAVIGRDTRQSCDMLECAVAAGLESRGVDVRFAGVVPTPAVAMLTRETGAALGVVISASHNPYDDNGIKFFGPDGYKLDDERELAIERRLLAEDHAAPAPAPDGFSLGRHSRLDDAVDRYVSFVRATAGDDMDLFAGLTVVLDAANGAACETSAAVLRSLGARVLPHHDRPTGININENCGCTHPEVIESLVRETGADVGVSHDGDADRVLLCDETGSVLDGDEIMAIAATALIEEGSLVEDTLVATIMSNAGLDEAVARAGGRVVRAGVGDRYVIEEMRRHGYNLGGEQSGHFIFRDHNTTGDGIVSAVQLLRIMKRRGQPLSELRRVMEKFPQAKRNLRVARQPELGTLKAASTVGETEKAVGEAGRVLLRYSGTEPLLRVLVEGRDADLIEREADRLAGAFAEEIGAE